MMRYDRQTQDLLKEIATLRDANDKRILSAVARLKRTATALNDNYLLGFTYYHSAYGKYYFRKNYGNFTDDLVRAARYLVYTNDHEILARVCLLFRSGDTAAARHALDELVTYLTQERALSGYIDDINFLCRRLLAEGMTSACRKIIDVISAPLLSSGNAHTLRLLNELQVDCYMAAGDKKRLSERGDIRSRLGAEAASQKQFGCRHCFCFAGAVYRGSGSEKQIMGFHAGSG